MIGLRITMPVASWRDEFSRQYRRTHPLPPPATCYGFLLSLVGERDAAKYHGNRVSAGMVNTPEQSIILRKINRSGKTNIPDHQEVLTDVDLVIWAEGSLEARVIDALHHPEKISRFGGLSLGESSFMVNTVSVLKSDTDIDTRTFLTKGLQRITLPLIADHNTNRKTVYATGDIEEISGIPETDRLPIIARTAS